MKTKDIDNSEEPLEVLGKVEPNVLFQAMNDLYNKIRTPQRSDNKTVEDSSATFDRIRGNLEYNIAWDFHMDPSDPC